MTLEIVYQIPFCDEDNESFEIVDFVQSQFTKQWVVIWRCPQCHEEIHKPVTFHLLGEIAQNYMRKCPPFSKTFSMVAWLAYHADK